MAALGFSIAKHILLPREGESKNVVFSPSSIHVLLSMVTVGSNGPSRDELLSFLQSKSIDDLTSFASQLFALMHSSCGGPSLLLANGVWVDKSLSLKPSFSQVVKTTYNATLASLDFKNEVHVANEINSWAEKETNGLIKQVLDSHSVKFTNLILANALYFKGSWVNHTFKESLTRDDDFCLLNGCSVKVPFMSGSHRQSVRAFDGFKILRLRYKGKDLQKRYYSMYIFLPDATDGLPALVEKVCSEPESLEGMLPHYCVELRDFRIPKFKISYGFQASHVLKDMGLVLPFAYGALTEIVDAPTHVSEIIHKCVIEVNEKGTEAAAVSATRLSSCSLSREKPIDFVADHPFLFLIREDSTGTILFIGQMLNPLDCL